MKKLLLFLICIPTLSWSLLSYDWEKIGIAKPDGGYYLDFGKIKKIDNFFYAWVLHDFGSVKYDPEYKSAVMYLKLDCKLHRTMFMEIHGVNKSMGRGNHKSISLPEDKWKYPPSGSFADDALNIVCKKKGLCI